MYFSGIGNDFFSRRVKFDSWFNVMAVQKFPEMDQKSFIALTGIRK